MKGSLILLDHIGARQAAARFIAGRLHDLLIDDDSAPRPGAIFRAICDRPMKGQGGMMLRLPDGETGFLRGAKGLDPGQPLLVQVTGYAEEGKAIPVTAKLLFKSRYAIVTPGAPGINISRAIRDEEERLRLKALGLGSGAEGVILRSAAQGAKEDEIAEDIAAMADLCAAVLADAEGAGAEALTEGAGPHEVAWREWSEPAQVETEPGCFAHHEVLELAREALAGIFPIESGWISVEPTRAFVAVDVNTGGDTGQGAGLRANIAALRELPRALGLLGLGGQVVIDAAPMPKGQRKQVEQALRVAFKADLVETSFAGWTPLGHIELQRKRERRPLRALLK